jgi:Arc/MetJ family transcription regulator
MRTTVRLDDALLAETMALATGTDGRPTQVVESARIPGSTEMWR